MPRNRSQRSSRRRTVQRNETEQTQLLTRILEIQKTQQNSSIEQVKDVPRIYLKRDKVHTFTRTAVLGSVLASPSGTGSAFAIRLALLPNASDFTDLFEQYRIIQLVYLFTPVVALGSGALSHPPISTWIDQDDNSPPSSAESLQNQTLRISPQGSFVERCVRPQLSQDGLVTNTIVTAYSAPPTFMWVDDANPNALYYGLKSYVGPSSQTIDAPLWNVNVTAVIQCRRPK